MFFVDCVTRHDHEMLKYICSFYIDKNKIKNDNKWMLVEVIWKYKNKIIFDYEPSLYTCVEGKK